MRRRRARSRGHQQRDNRHRRQHHRAAPPPRSVMAHAPRQARHESVHILTCRVRAEHLATHIAHCGQVAGKGGGPYRTHEHTVQRGAVVCARAMETRANKSRQVTTRGLLEIVCRRLIRARAVRHARHLDRQRGNLIVRHAPRLLDARHQPTCLEIAQRFATILRQQDRQRCAFDERAGNREAQQRITRGSGQRVDALLHRATSSQCGDQCRRIRRKPRLIDELQLTTLNYQLQGLQHQQRRAIAGGVQSGDQRVAPRLGRQLPHTHHERADVVDRER